MNIQDWPVVVRIAFIAAIGGLLGYAFGGVAGTISADLFGEIGMFQPGELAWFPNVSAWCCAVAGAAAMVAGVWFFRRDSAVLAEEEGRQARADDRPLQAEPPTNFKSTSNAWRRGWFAGPRSTD